MIHQASDKSSNRIAVVLTNPGALRYIQGQVRQKIFIQDPRRYQLKINTQQEKHDPRKIPN